MKVFIFILFVSCAFSAVVKVKRDVGDSAWDEIIDQAIDAAKDDIIDKHLDSIDLPIFNEHIDEKILGIPFTIDVTLQGGEFHNLSTVRRDAEVTVLQDDETGNITIATALGLDDFSLNVESLMVHVFGLTVDGSLSMKSESNSLEFSISLITDKEENCKAYINWARVTAFTDFTVKVNPAGLVNWLAEHITSVILNDFSSHVMVIINDKLTPYLNDAISKVDICGYVPI